MKSYGIWCLSFLGLFLVSAQSTQAASLYIDPAMPTIARGDAIPLSVRLDTDEEAGECINAVDVVITYPDTVVPVDVSIGESILSVWVESPKIDTETRTITFAGGIPNGYCGRVEGDPRLTNILATLIFRSPGFSIGNTASEGTIADIMFKPETMAYLNDGLGTKAELALYGSRITLTDTPGEQLQDPWRDAVLADTFPPAPFSIELTKDPFAFGGKYFISFSTTDKETGISHYEVMEEPLSDFMAFNWGRADAPWIQTTSPYTLRDQSLNSTIRVRAIDKAGNEYIATLVPEDDLRTVPITTYVMWLVGLVIIGLFVSSVWITVRYLKKKRSQSDVSTEDNKA